MGKEGAVGDQALGAARAAGLLGSPGSAQPQLSWHEGAGERRLRCARRYCLRDRPGLHRRPRSALAASKSPCGIIGEGASRPGNGRVGRTGDNP
jgi:hypothetical protein